LTRIGTFDTSTGIVETAVAAIVTGTTVATDIAGIATSVFTLSEEAGLSGLAGDTSTGFFDTRAIVTEFTGLAGDTSAGFDTFAIRGAAEFVGLTSRRGARVAFAGCALTEFAVFAGCFGSVTTCESASALETDLSVGTIHINNAGRTFDTLPCQTTLVGFGTGHTQTGVIDTGADGATRTDAASLAGAGATGVGETGGLALLTSVADFSGFALSSAGIFATAPIFAEFTSFAGHTFAGLDTFAIGGATDLTSVATFAHAIRGQTLTVAADLAFGTRRRRIAGRSIAETLAQFFDADLVFRTIDIVKTLLTDQNVQCLACTARRLAVVADFNHDVDLLAGVGLSRGPCNRATVGIKLHTSGAFFQGPAQFVPIGIVGGRHITIALADIGYDGSFACDGGSVIDVVDFDCPRLSVAGPTGVADLNGEDL
jgi:hypothetical protein